MGLWLMAGITFREAARRKILWTALIAGAAFLAIFGIGLHLQMAEFQTRNTAPFLRFQVMSSILLIGLYTVDLLAVVMTILTAIDTISGEIASGTINAIAMKPIARWQILVGKWTGFAGMVAIYVAMMFGGTIAMGSWLGGVTPQNAVRGAALVYLECMVALTVTIMFGTWFSTLTNGVLVLGLHGLAFMGGWLEQMSGFTQSSKLVLVGVYTSLIMPSEAIWRRAAFEMQPPLAGSLQFTIFQDVSVPSATMIGYAGAYVVIALAIAIYHFQKRDL
ncbi:MAG TPA: ABC transporter permease subunit [Candidatus Acidoferrales bacterium]|jgi:ABC-type transport system involved in multi-copper enzyme maturation permease subunit|nr:ABC transporter permease subunit [Candidatus Acidoferrales bacterium]